MTSRENVLRVYSDAYAVYELTRGWVVYSLSYRGADNDHVLGQGRSEDGAWDDAWATIQASKSPSDPGPAGEWGMSFTGASMKQSFDAMAGAAELPSTFGRMTGDLKVPPLVEALGPLTERDLLGFAAPGAEDTFCNKLIDRTDQYVASPGAPEGAQVDQFRWGGPNFHTDVCKCGDHAACLNPLCKCTCHAAKQVAAPAATSDALRKLAAEVRGWLDLEPVMLARVFGNTNMAVMRDRLALAESALAQPSAEGQRDHKPQYGTSFQLTSGAWLDFPTTPDEASVRKIFEEGEYPVRRLLRYDPTVIAELPAPPSGQGEKA